MQCRGRKNKYFVIEKSSKRNTLLHTLLSAEQGGIRMNTFQLYKDIEARTKGEIYIGVVGPVRTGKSTFIKRFMDVLVLPHMEDENKKKKT